MTTGAPILLVEDEEAVRWTIREVLEEAGHSVVEASNGAEAMQQLRGGLQPRLILLDLMMPVMSGDEFLEVRAREKLDASPVYILSAMARDAIVATAAKHGIAGFIQKPLQLDPLLEVAEKFRA